MNQLQIRLFYHIVFTVIPLYAGAQVSEVNRYGLRVIASQVQFQKTIHENAGKSMSNLKRAIPGIALDLRYATANNFMHQKLYPHLRTTWLRKAAADSLANVQKELIPLGLCVKIFDAYRPYSITEKMWEKVNDERYAANPKNGSGHNRGIAVDLTIINLQTKVELDMGTGFDNFSDTAHISFGGLPYQSLKNRALLREVMEKHGFIALKTEWWHFSLPNSEDYELLDIPFRAFRR